MGSCPPYVVSGYTKRLFSSVDMFLGLASVEACPKSISLTFSNWLTMIFGGSEENKQNVVNFVDVGVDYLLVLALLLLSVQVNINSRNVWAVVHLF